MAILFSRLIAFVECCVAVPANRIGLKTMTLEQGIRYLSREEKVRHITGRPRKVVKRLIVPKKKRKPERTRPSGSSPDLERRHGLVENRAVGRIDAARFRGLVLDAEHHERLVSRIADGPLACGGDTDGRTLLHRDVHAVDLQRLQHSHFTTL